MIKIIAINSKFIHTNTAVWYLHYSLLKNNIDNQINSYSINDQYDDVLYDILKDNVSILCFSCYIWNVEYTMKLINDIKNIDSSIKIIVGGPEVSFDCENVLRNNPIDVIIRGEGENVITNVINGDYVTGCAYLQNKQYIDSGYVIVDELNDIPFIFTKEMLETEKHKIIYYESSRGCPHQCIYCLSSTLSGVRYLPVERVLAELSILASGDINQIKFVDRTFNLNEKRTLTILNHIKNLPGSINFHLEIYPASLTDKIMECLLSMPIGRVQIEAGIQSTNQETLDVSKRYQNSILALSNAKKIIDNHNIHVHLDLIAGLPLETKEIFMASFNETIEVRPHMLQLGFLKLLKGTKARQVDGYISQNIAPYEVLVTKWLSLHELFEIKLVEKVVDEFYNTNKFLRSIAYLLSANKNAYNLFLQIALHIQSKYTKDYHLNEKDKYEILYQLDNESNKIKELLRFDYLSSHKSKSVYEFLDNNQKIKEKVFAYFTRIGKNAKIEYKQTNVNQFSFDTIETYLFDYREKNQVTNTFTSYKIEL